MEKWNRIDGSMALTEKERRVITIEAAERPQEIKLRVAAYARVSSASEDQLNSFAAQQRYYTELIDSKENWTLVDIYADEGITGTSAKKRADFQRLMTDCRKGRIDRILTKSISRFARNTKECLETVRELKLLGIGVCFEEQNINTAEMTGEMLTAAFASIAQSESESISKNVRWGIQKRMREGTYLPSHQPYGYRIENGRICIDEAKAETVRKIFFDYLAGFGIEAIATQLNQMSVCDPQGRKWEAILVSRVLKNEKYTGDSLWQKTYKTETLPRQKCINHGEKDRYFVENTHPAIISKEVYEKAQRLLRQRNSGGTSQSAKESPFREKVICACCGNSLRRTIANGQAYRVCRTHAKGKTDCTLPPVPETELCNAFCRLYYNLKYHGEQLLSETLSGLTAIRERRMLWSEDVITLNRKISDLSSQYQMLTEFKQKNLIDPDIYIAQSNALTEQLRSAKREKERLLDADGDTTIQDTREILDTLENGPDFLDHFDAELFGELIEKIIVESNVRIRFRLKNGLELPETIERMVR